MLAEAVISFILWSTVDKVNDAELRVVNCNKVELHYGGDYSSRKKNIAFWMQDRDYKHTCLYVWPMKIHPTGAILLEPAAFWVEEIRSQKNLKLRIDDKYYNFDLTGSMRAINCD
jgi:hypothetical protein